MGAEQVTIKETPPTHGENKETQKRLCKSYLKSKRLKRDSKVTIASAFKIKEIQKRFKRDSKETTPNKCKIKETQRSFERDSKVTKVGERPSKETQTTNRCTPSPNPCWHMSKNILLAATH